MSDEEPGYYRGEGWYKKSIIIPTSWKEKEVYLYFEGVGQVAEVTLYKKQPMKKSDRHEDLIDDVNSGNYLVAAINHQISIDGHTCYIELIKDSMKKKVD